MWLAERNFRYRITMWLLDVAEYTFDNDKMRLIFGSAYIRDVLHEVDVTRKDFRAWKARGYGPES